MNKVDQKIGDFKAQENKYNIEMKDRIEIINFLKRLNEKNYAEAHKYLKKIMESRVKQRIASHKGIKVF
jgi:hypothetical protein